MTCEVVTGLEALAVEGSDHSALKLRFADLTQSEQQPQRRELRPQWNKVDLPGDLVGPLKRELEKVDAEYGRAVRAFEVDAVYFQE